VKLALFETHVTWYCYQSGCIQFNDHILGNFMVWSLRVKHVVGSGVTRGLSQGRQRMVWRGHTGHHRGPSIANTQKKLCNDSEPLDVVDVYISWKNENISKNAKKQQRKEY